MRTGRVRYHSVCIGAHDNTVRSAKIRGDWRQADGHQSFAFRTYASILAKLRLGSVAAMKMDIEGFEYGVLNPMLRSRSAALPSQIALEVHWQTQMTALPWHHRAKTTGEIALFARALYDAGYRTLSRVDNWRCPHCSEFNFIRLFCPPAAASQQPEAAVDDPPLIWGTSDPAEGCDNKGGRAGA